MQTQFNSHFEMKMHLKTLSTQEQKEYLWSKGFSIEQANDYLKFAFPKGEKCQQATSMQI